MKNYESFKSILTPEQVLSLFFVHLETSNSDVTRRTAGGKLEQQGVASWIFKTPNRAKQSRLRTGLRSSLLLRRDNKFTVWSLSFLST